MGSIWTALGNRLETAWKRPTKPNSKRPKDGEIIDEEKSVRWNREEVVRRQKAWDAECSRLKKAQNAEIEHISEAIELQIQEDIKAKTKRSISKKAATILWQKAYDRGHAYGFADIYCAIEDYEELVVAGKRVLGIPVEHRVPMLSLLDVFSDDEVRSFVDSVKAEYSDVTFSVERKIDGLSLSLVYERSDDGLAYLTQASTRGDGHVGEGGLSRPSFGKLFSKKFIQLLDGVCDTHRIDNVTEISLICHSSYSSWKKDRCPYWVSVLFLF